MPTEQLSFKLPPQDLDVLSFSGPEPKRVAEWVDALPKMNVGESAKRLYAAIQELNRLKTDAHGRLQIMEAMRGPIHYICQSLEKHFLNRAVVLPPKEAKIASLAQALQHHLAIGYKTVVMQSLARVKKSDKEAKKHCQLAIHRAVTEQGRVLLRSFQLYFPAPPGFWRELHLLYLLAQRFGMLESLQKDTEEDGWESSIEDQYLRVLLLATARPNQLRQQQIERVYSSARYWAQLASITDTKRDDGLFAIDVTSDFPPIYQSLMRRSVLPHNIRYFDASEISEQLRTFLQLPEGQSHPVKTFHIPQKLAADLCRILIQAWGVLSERAFTRIDEQGQLKLSVGLSATHYFVSGKQDFGKMVSGTSRLLSAELNNPFLHSAHGRREALKNNDVWGLNMDSAQVSADDSGVTAEINAHDDLGHLAEKDKYPSYQCDIINTSPGGFCVSWKQDAPPQVKTGEIVGILEQGKSHWCVAVIRWVKQFKNEGVRMGVELIAPKAEACGTQVVQKKGDVTEYMRTLMLPELRAIGQPATLITPNIAFNVGCKVNVSENGEISIAQLTKQVTSTPSFCQFQFKMLVLSPSREEMEKREVQTSRTDSSPGEPDDDFDSIWSSL